MRCEESMEPECPGWWYSSGNGCVMDPNENCGMDMCKFCIKTAHRKEDGTSVNYSDECIDCEEGWRQEDGHCVEDKPEHPEERWVWCPEDESYSGCSLCRLSYWWIEENDEGYYAENTVCDWCKNGEKNPTRGECLDDPMDGAWNCSDSGNDYLNNCGMCRN